MNKLAGDKRNRRESQTPVEIASMPQDSMNPIDLPVPIYLNQQIVFDLLAILEDGFSQLSTIKTSATETESQKSSIGGNIGVSNAFAFLGVTLSGQRGKERGVTEQTEVLKERVHTPTSLFALLRLILLEKSLLKKIQTNDKIDTFKSGQFVEFRAVLRKNPLVDTFETMKQVGELALSISKPEQILPKGGKRGKQDRSQNTTQAVMQQLDAMLTDITRSNSVELIGEMLDIPGAKSVLSTSIDYFIDRDASAIIDGEFCVLGKIIRVVESDSEATINLLRKTSFGHLDRSILDPFIDVIEGMSEAGIKVPKFEAEIKGPAFQIYPIAIFA